MVVRPRGPPRCHRAVQREPVTASGVRQDDVANVRAHLPVDGLAYDAHALDSRGLKEELEILKVAMDQMSEKARHEKVIESVEEKKVNH